MTATLRPSLAPEIALHEALSPESPAASAFIPSPNHGERPDGRRPDMLILHYTGMDDEEAALRWLCNPVSKVSAHYLVSEAGEVVQLVAESRRAWHAGLGAWAGEFDMNNCSIGIEIANAGHPAGLPPFREAQIASVVALCRDIVARWAIHPGRVLGHSDVAPGRKLDPGERFPWARLHEEGIGHWVKPAALGDGRCLRRGNVGQPVGTLQSMLGRYGYGVGVTGVFGEETETVVASFQRHFRPELVDGVADVSTIATLIELLTTRPPANAGAI
jgi:N-acetylmuramoyl-L-alanine amidase